MTAPSHTYRTHLLSVAALLCLVAALYGPTVGFHFVNWDDRHHIYANPAVVAPETAPALDRWLGRNIGYPLPLTLATWRLDRARVGPASRAEMRPDMGKGYHQTQLVLIGLFALALYLLGAVTIAPGWPAALMAALVLAHPVAVEPLAWITGRKDLLVGIFSVLTLAALWRAREEAGGTEQHPTHKIATKSAGHAVRWWGLATLLACLAMASKPTGISLAAFSVWAGFLGQKRGVRAPKAAWIGVVLLVALGALVVVVGSIWHEDVGGVQHGETHPILRSLHATSWHLHMLAAPTWLRAKYVLAAPESLAGTELWLRVGLTLLAGLSVMVAAVRWRRTPVGWAAAFALAAWVPVSNLVPLRRHVADSYMLLPLIALSWGVMRAVHTWVTRGAGRRGMWIMVAGGVLVALLSMRTVPQAQTWRTSVQLWQHTLRHQKNSPQVCRMAGHGLFFEGQKRDAVTLWEACIERFGPALFANNLAIAAMQTQQPEKARRWFRWLLKRNPNDRRARRYLQRLGPATP